MRLVLKFALTEVPWHVSNRAHLLAPAYLASPLNSTIGTEAHRVFQASNCEYIQMELPTSVCETVQIKIGSSSVEAIDYSVSWGTCKSKILKIFKTKRSCSIPI